MIQIDPIPFSLEWKLEPTQRSLVEFADTFDAGVLVIYHNPTSWAKLCVEYLPQPEPMIVSVVTKGTSDGRRIRR